MVTRAPTVDAELLGKPFYFRTHPGLFCADAVDDGTRLLLDALPARPPARVLDLGCGYGALGLPVAARFPRAHCLLVDRDALAAEYSGRNAVAHGLGNVEARPSLGYRDVGAGAWDWVLCNVPARIGDAAIAYILGEGARRLTPEGELRVVVIRDLGFVVERIAAEHGWPVRRCADGPRHLVYALGPLPAEGAAADHEALYLRDRVRTAGLVLERPHDINEDAAHLRDAVPLLLELLPRQPQGPCLLWRGGYGAAAVTLVQRGGRVVAADRDLLATTYARRNVQAAGGPGTLEVRDAYELAQGVREGERFAFVAGEVHASAGEDANAADVLTSLGCLGKGGMALWLGLTRQAKGWMERLQKGGRVGTAVLATRGAYTAWRVTLPAKR